jgi:hypothetical protein
LFPESAPKVSSLDQQIAAIKIPIEKRQEFFSSYDPATQC